MSRDRIELVRHTRRIHFALGLFSVLVVLAQEQGGGEVSGAYRSLQSIMSATEKWDPLRFDRISEVAVAAQDRDFNRIEMVFDSPLYGSDSTHFILQMPRNFTLHDASNPPIWELSTEPINMGMMPGMNMGMPGMGMNAVSLPPRPVLNPRSFPAYVDTPSTITQFKRCWDWANSGPLVYSIANPSSKILVSRQASDVDKDIPTESISHEVFEWRIPKRINTRDYVSPALLPMREAEIYFWRGQGLGDRFTHKIQHRVGSEIFDLPVAMKRIPIDAQGYLVNLGPTSPDWRRGPFSYSFRVLDKITADYQDVSFQQAEILLRAAMDAEVSTFESFGIKLPLSAIRRLGLLLIVVLQGYLLVHLSRLCATMTPRDLGWDSAWLLLYPGRGALLSVIVSMVVLPTGVCLYVTKDVLFSAVKLDLQWTDALLLLFVAFGLILAVRTLSQVLFFRHRIPGANA